MIFGRYKYSETEEKELLSSVTILVDTREKVNNHIIDYFDSHNIPYKKKALGQGDYSFYVPENEHLGILRDTFFDKEIIIERKASLEELSNNLSNERARFEEELSTAKAKRKYLLIENANYSDVVAGNYNTQYNKKSYLGTLHSFNHKYDLQLVFMPDNKYSGIFIYGVMQYYLRNQIR